MDALFNGLANIVAWLKLNWVPLAAGLWLVEQGLRAVSRLTVWKWDDNLVDVLANVLQSIFPKRQS